MKNSRAKGAAFEREIAKGLREIGIVAHRAQQADQAWQPDVVIEDERLSTIWPELKCGANPSPWKAMDQAIADSERVGGEKVPLVIAKRDRDHTLVFLRLEDVLKILVWAREEGVL